MSDETMYDSGANYESQLDDATFGDENNLANEEGLENKDASKGKKKSNLATAGIAAGAGVAGAAGGVLFSNLANASQEQETDDIVTDDIVTEDDGQEDEVLQDPVVEEEPVVDEPVQPDPIIGHNMPVAHGVDDSMSFNEAFAAARHEVGAGGLFEWHGQVYGTYYGNEWDAMSDADKEQYWADVSHSAPHMDEYYAEGHSEHPGFETTHEPIVDDVPMASLDVDSSSIIEEYDLDGDGTPDVALVDYNNNEIQDVIMDTTGDGHYDTLIVDPMVDDDGNLIMADNSIHEFDHIDIVQDDVVDPVDPGIVGPEPFETGVLTFNESEVYNEADVDGDGVVDALIVDADGNESLDLVLDTTGDGNLDTLVLNPGVDDEGNLVYDDNSVVGIGGVMVTPDEGLEMPDDTFMADNQGVDDLADVDFDPDITIDNNMDMDDFA